MQIGSFFPNRSTDFNNLCLKRKLLKRRRVLSNIQKWCDSFLCVIYESRVRCVEFLCWHPIKQVRKQLRQAGQYFHISRTRLTEHGSTEREAGVTSEFPIDNVLTTPFLEEVGHDAEARDHLLLTKLPQTSRNKY